MGRHTQLTDWLRQWKGAPEARAKLMRALKEPHSLHAIVELAGEAAPTNLEAVLSAGRNGWERALPVMRVVSWPEGEMDRLRDLLGRTMVGARVASTELPGTRSDLAGRFLHRYLPVYNAPLQGAMFLWSWLVDSALDWDDEEVATGVRGGYSLASFISGVPPHTVAAVTDNILGDPHILMPPVELTQALALLGRRVLRWDGIRYVPVWGKVNRVLFDNGGSPAGGGQQLVVTGAPKECNAWGARIKWAKKPQVGGYDSRVEGVGTLCGIKFEMSAYTLARDGGGSTRVKVFLPGGEKKQSQDRISGGILAAVKGGVQLVRDTVGFGLEHKPPWEK